MNYEAYHFAIYMASLAVAFIVLWVLGYYWLTWIFGKVDELEERFEARRKTFRHDDIYRKRKEVSHETK